MEVDPTSNNAPDSGNVWLVLAKCISVALYLADNNYLITSESSGLAAILLHKLERSCGMSKDNHHEIFLSKNVLKRRHLQEHCRVTFEALDHGYHHKRLVVCTLPNRRSFVPVEWIGSVCTIPPEVSLPPTRLKSLSYFVISYSTCR